MSNKPDGGPAFPVPEYVGSTTDGEKIRQFNSPTQEGMTLRDYFAAAALRGMLVSGFMPQIVHQDCNTCDFDYTRAAYALADRMLKARAQ